jgi:hypothetical protein
MVPDFVNELFPAVLRSCESLSRIEIPRSIEIIADNCFSNSISLQEVIFTSDSHLRVLAGFWRCTSLCRLAIPASFEIIKGFDDNCSLKDVIFPSDSHLRELDGFSRCTSLCHLAVPASVEIIKGFDGNCSLRELIVRPGSQLKVHAVFRGCHLFIVCEDDDFIKGSRRRLHLRGSGVAIYSGKLRSLQDSNFGWHSDFDVVDDYL